MKKTAKRIFLVLFCAILATAAFAESYSVQATYAAEKKQGKKAKKGKTLVVYFSQSGTTAKVAKRIQKITDADIFRIRTEKEYPSDYDELVDMGQSEQEEQARPALKKKVKAMGQYDIIIIGYPIWWDDAPMAVYSFLESYDLSGKTILPFCTSGGSDISQSVRNIRGDCKNADVKNGLTANGVSNKRIRRWLTKNKAALK